jgi:hypothetical protein
MPGTTRRERCRAPGRLGTRAGGALKPAFGLRSGSPWQRSAFSSCRPALLSGKDG